MRCSSPSSVNGCIYGVLSIAKAKCWISWLSHADTRRRRPNCEKSKTLSQMPLSQTNCHLMVLPSRIRALPGTMISVAGRTIHTCRSNSGNDERNVPDRLDQCNGLSLPTPSSTTPSYFPKIITLVSQPCNGPVANRCLLSLSSVPIRGTAFR